MVSLLLASLPWKAPWHLPVHPVPSTLEDVDVVQDRIASLQEEAGGLLVVVDGLLDVIAGLLTVLHF